MAALGRQPGRASVARRGAARLQPADEVARLVYEAAQRSGHARVAGDRAADERAKQQAWHVRRGDRAKNAKGGADQTGKSAGGIELMGKSAVQEDPQAAMVSSYRRKLSMMLN